MEFLSSQHVFTIPRPPPPNSITVDLITKKLQVMSMFTCPEPFQHPYLQLIPRMLLERVPVSVSCLNYLEVRRSAIHGKGCFAKQDIPKDEVITMYPCDVLCFAKEGFGNYGLNGHYPSRHYVAKFGQKIDTSEITNYGFDLNRNYRIYGHPKLIHNSGYLGHMINDGARANLNPKSYSIYQKISQLKMNARFEILYGNIHVGITTTRLIKKGEEIFIHYGLGHWVH
jgi:SET domain-containing protein